LEENKVVIGIANGSFSFDAENVNEFPVSMVIGKTSEIQISLSSDIFLEAIKKGTYINSRTDNRTSLSGLQFLFSKENLKVNSADERRLIQLTYQIENEKEFDLLIDKNYMKSIGNIFKESKEIFIKVFPDKIEEDKQITKGFVQFTSDNIEVNVQQIDGMFPDVEKVIPKDENFEKRYFINRKELINSIKQIMPMLNKQTYRWVYHCSKLL